MLLEHNAVNNAFSYNNPNSKVHGANMGSTCVLSTPGGPHVGPMNLAIWEDPIEPTSSQPVNVTNVHCSYIIEQLIYWPTGHMQLSRYLLVTGYNFVGICDTVKPLI